MTFKKDENFEKQTIELEKEAEKINKEIGQGDEKENFEEIEEKNINKNNEEIDDTGHIPKEDNINNKNIKNKTKITDEEREKYNIPEKFIYMEDVTAWGSQAEKSQAKTRTEYDRLLKEKEEMNRRIAYLEGVTSQINKTKELSEEEKVEINNKLLEDFNNDPSGTLEKILDKRDKILQEKEKKRQFELQQKNINERIKKEEEELIEKIGEHEFFNNVQHKLKEIYDRKTKEGQRINSLKDIYAIYKYEKEIMKNQMKEETEEKRNIKKKSYTEISTPITKEEPDIMNKIMNAKDIKELDKIVSNI